MLRPRIFVASLLCAGAVIAGAVPVASTTSKYPVTWHFSDGVVANGQNPTGSPPGSNIWTCRPTAAHPRPVVLVHGLMATPQDDFQTLAPVLANHGYCVYTFTYGTENGNPYFGGLPPMEQTARQLSVFVQRVLRATHVVKVDLVGHSEGTVMPRYWMEFMGGARYVSHYVMFTPIWHGTMFFGAAQLQQLGNAYVPGFSAGEAQTFNSNCGSCPEMLTGSPFLLKLESRGYALPGVQYTDIMTRYDELVQPYTSGFVYSSNVTNYVLQDQCSQDLTDHVAAVYDPTAAQDMLNALDPAHARPVPCVPVLPGFGAVTPPPAS